MKRSTLILIGILALGLAGACSKQALKATYDKQATNIEGFITARMKADTNATLVKTGGSFRVNLHDTLGFADSLNWEGQVALWYACYTLTGTSITSANLVATNVRSLAESVGWKLSDTTRYHLDTLRLDKNLVEGLRNGLWGVQPGDEAFILFTGEYGYGSTERGTIPARSALVYQVLIESIKNE